MEVISCDFGLGFREAGDFPPQLYSHVPLASGGTSRPVFLAITFGNCKRQRPTPVCILPNAPPLCLSCGLWVLDTVSAERV